MLNNVKKWKRYVVASFYLDLAQLTGELFRQKDKCSSNFYSKDRFIYILDSSNSRSFTF